MVTVEATTYFEDDSLLKQVNNIVITQKAAEENEMELHTYFSGDGIGITARGGKANALGFYMACGLEPYLISTTEEDEATYIKEALRGSGVDLLHNDGRMEQL